MNKKLFTLATATFLGSFMCTLDISIVNVAIPSIQNDINMSFSGTQWIINAYAVCLAAFILAAGGLSNKFGLKKIWLLGMGIFTLSSLICSISDELVFLIIGRALQGIGGAIIIPGALSIIFYAVKDEKLRSSIVGAWSTCTAVALIIGPTLGGFLVDYMSWRSVFFINIPIGIIAFLLGVYGIQETIREKKITLNICGQALSILFISGFIYSMIEIGNNTLISLAVILPFIGSLTLLILFILTERRKNNSLIPFELFKLPSFIVSNIASLILGFSYYSSLFFFSILFQDALGLNGVQTGLRMMPIFIFTALSSLLFSKLSTKITSKKIMVIAYSLIGVAMFTLGILDTKSSKLTFDFMLIFIGIGTGLAVPATSIEVLGRVESRYYSIASSFMNSLRQMGMALGIAILGSIMSIATVLHAASFLKAVKISNAESIANSFILKNSTIDSNYLKIYHDSISYGFQWSMIIAAIPCIIIAILIAVKK